MCSAIARIAYLTLCRLVNTMCNRRATKGTGVGSWISFRFDRNVQISQIRLQQRTCSCEWFRELQLAFSDGTEQLVSLPPSKDPVTMTITPTGYIRSVKITALSMYATTNPGFVEVAFFGSY